MTEEFSDIPLFMEEMADSIKKTTAGLDKAQTSAFFLRILDAKRIYVTGAGRSGLIARAFAMRLLHLGFDVFVVGETVTPAIPSWSSRVRERRTRWQRSVRRSKTLAGLSSS